MAKRSRANEFRKVDVDQYNEDNYQDDVLEDDSYREVNDADISSMLTQGKQTEALKIVLSNPPASTKNQIVKDKALQQVLQVLLSFKASQIEAAVNSLDMTQLDFLMKYIYRGFENPPENNTLLLTWHEKTFARGKVGCIIRVLTDRKQV